MKTEIQYVKLGPGEYRAFSTKWVEGADIIIRHSLMPKAPRWVISNLDHSRLIYAMTLRHAKQIIAERLGR